MYKHTVFLLNGTTCAVTTDKEELAVSYIGGFFFYKIGDNDKLFLIPTSSVLYVESAEVKDEQ